MSLPGRIGHVGKHLEQISTVAWEDGIESSRKIPLRVREFRAARRGSGITAGDSIERLENAVSE